MKERVILEQTIKIQKQFKNSIFNGCFLGIKYKKLA